jgi:uncharacterized repeat protein (TIGR04138 family)
MSRYQREIADIVRRDPRYPYEAYEFVFDALAHREKALGPAARGGGAEAADDFSGPELLYALRDFARREFGLMARVVFRRWGVNRTDDFGEIMFNLIDAGLISKTARDSRRDFHAVYDLDEELLNGYCIRLDEGD